VTPSRRPTSRSTAPDAPSSIASAVAAASAAASRKPSSKPATWASGPPPSEPVRAAASAATMRLDGGHPALDLVNTVYGAGRRWCSMADCGTEAKKRRYVQRRRERRAAASM